MSLILDALKKSEQERRRDKGPDLQTIHQPALIRAPQRSYRTAWVALILTINVAVVAYWWQQRGVAPVAATATPIAAAPTPVAATNATSNATSNATTSTATNAVANAATNTVANAATNTTVNERAAPPQETASSAEYTRITPANQVAAAQPSSSTRIEEVDELPDDIRNNLPAMTFSFHVYSSNPQQRTIIINNRRMREGEEVNAGLLLQEITEDGVILSYAQHRIHIGVLSGW